MTSLQPHPILTHKRLTILIPHIPGGIVLYSRSFNPNFANIDKSGTSPVAALFDSVLVDGKRREEDNTFDKGGFSVRWLRENELGLVFVVSALRENFKDLRRKNQC